MRQTPEWREKYVQAFISMGGVFGGSVVLAHYMISGAESPFGVPWISAHPFRRMVEAMAGLALAMPAHYGVGDGADSDAEPIVITPDREYFANDEDIRQLLIDANRTATLEVWEAMSEEMRHAGTPPLVDTWCIYTDDIPTERRSGATIVAHFVEDPVQDTANIPPAPDHANTIRIPSKCLCRLWSGVAGSLVYSKSFPAGVDEQPEVVKGDGDGTVHAASLRVCDGWAAQDPDHSYKVIRTSNVAHSDALMDPGVLSRIQSIVNGLLPQL